MKKISIITVQNIDISVSTENNVDYICLTDNGHFELKRCMSAHCLQRGGGFTQAGVPQRFGRAINFQIHTKLSAGIHPACVKPLVRGSAFIPFPLLYLLIYKLVRFLLCLISTHLTLFLRVREIAYLHPLTHFQQIFVHIHFHLLCILTIT